MKKNFKNSGLLPLVVGDENNKISEITICDSISGGVNEINHMPKTFTLKRRKIVNGVWQEFSALYEIKEY